MSKKQLEPLCKNCLLYNHDKKECKVAILINGSEHHLPVLPNDRCHMDELGIPVQQVRWWVEDENGNKIDGNGIVKMEYPENFFGEERK